MVEKDDHLIQSFRKRGDEYHIPVRKGSWEKLEAELLSHPVSYRLKYRWITIAAVILICFTLSLPFILKDIPEIVDVTSKNKVESPAPRKRIIPQLQEQQTILAVAPSSATPISYKKTADKIITGKTKENVSLTLDELSTEEETIIEEKDKAEKKKPESVAFVGPQQEKKAAINYNISSTRNTRQQSKWVFGISAGSNSSKGTSSEQISNESGNSIVDPPPFTDPGDETNTEDGEEKENNNNISNKPDSKAYILPLSKSEKEIIQHTYHHRLPISIGISAQKKLTNSFGLESGLTYTYLYSDISKKGMPGYIGNQKLHYLGIPLKANWVFYNQKRFNIYLSGGVFLEYCISANRKINNKKENLDFNRFQASVNTAAGLQIALIKPLSIFVEPGVSYYFDNGNKIETIRTDKPFMFNLQLGVRFTY